jgi:hypothetical protein
MPPASLAELERDVRRDLAEHRRDLLAYEVRHVALDPARITSE